MGSYQLLAASIDTSYPYCDLRWHGFCQDTCWGDMQTWCKKAGAENRGTSQTHSSFEFWKPHTHTHIITLEHSVLVGRKVLLKTCFICKNCASFAAHKRIKIPRELTHMSWDSWFNTTLRWFCELCLGGYHDKASSKHWPTANQGSKDSSDPEWPCTCTWMDPLKAWTGAGTTWCPG